MLWARSANSLHLHHRTLSRVQLKKVIVWIMLNLSCAWSSTDGVKCQDKCLKLFIQTIIMVPRIAGSPVPLALIIRVHALTYPFCRCWFQHCSSAITKPEKIFIRLREPAIRRHNWQSMAVAINQDRSWNAPN